jgi:hypothetical protein
MEGRGVTDATGCTARSNGGSTLAPIEGCAEAGAPSCTSRSEPAQTAPAAPALVAQLADECVGEPIHSGAATVLFEQGGEFSSRGKAGIVGSDDLWRVGRLRDRSPGSLALPTPAHRSPQADG